MPNFQVAQDHPYSFTSPTCSLWSRPKRNMCIQIIHSVPPPFCSRIFPLLSLPLYLTLPSYLPVEVQLFYSLNPLNNYLLRTMCTFLGTRAYINSKSSSNYTFMKSPWLSKIFFSLPSSYYLNLSYLSQSSLYDNRKMDDNR